MVRFAPDFALCEEDQPALAQPEGGTFLAFVLLEQPEWDAEEFKRTLRKASALHTPTYPKGFVAIRITHNG